MQTNKAHFSGSNVGVWTAITGVDPKTRERSYSATAYYKPNAKRSNLKILTEATVREVVLEKEGGEWVAKGVRFLHEGKEHVVRTKGEVIISAGSVQSPQLLELSGIGNAEILKAARIGVKVDNPHVGENLQDHMMTATIFETTKDIVTPEDLRADPALAAAADEAFHKTQSGPRTAIPSSIAYLPFAHYLPEQTLSSFAASIPKSSHPRDKVLHDRFTTTNNAKPLGQIEYCFDVSNYSPYYKSEPGKKYATMLMMLQYPFSTGSIHIPPSKEPGKPTTSNDKPIIDPKYYGGLGGQIDYEMMCAAQKFGDKICSTQPLASMFVKRVFPPAPSEALKQGGEEDFSDWVRNYTITDWHPVGTCSMGGKRASDGYVLDSRLRVYGVKGLRVCDASVMPLQISAHIQATIYAIGEKGAELIKEDWEESRVRPML